jgi:serine/threonine protein kinase
VKQENIMISEQGRVILIDLGLARPFANSATQSGRICGTVSYLSPEALRGEQLDQRSDIFSLGVTMFEMLTGQLPFKGRWTLEIIANIQNPRIKPDFSLLDNIPYAVRPKLQRILEKMLEKDRSQRYKNCDKILRDLEALKF